MHVHYIFNAGLLLHVQYFHLTFCAANIARNGPVCLAAPKQTCWKFLHSLAHPSLQISTNIRIQRCLKHRNPEICQSTSQGNSNAPTKRLFLKKPARLAPWARKKVSGTRAHTDSHSHRHEASETERERERERERKKEKERERERARARTRARERYRERERERWTRTPHSGAFQNMKQTLRKNIFRK